MRILVIATEPVDADRLAAALDDDVRDAEVKLVTPALNDSRLAFWVSDADQAIAEAEEAQAESLERLRADGIEAVGGVVDHPAALTDPTLDGDGAGTAHAATAGSSMPITFSRRESAVKANWFTSSEE